MGDRYLLRFCSAARIHPLDILASFEVAQLLLNSDEATIGQHLSDAQADLEQGVFPENFVNTLFIYRVIGVATWPTLLDGFSFKRGTC